MSLSPLTIVAAPLPVVFFVVCVLVASDGGRVDVALQVAQVDTEPGWVYMVLQGATTLWETWTGSRYQPVYVM